MFFRLFTRFCQWRLNRQTHRLIARQQAVQRVGLVSTVVHGLERQLAASKQLASNVAILNQRLEQMYQLSLETDKLNTELLGMNKAILDYLDKHSAVVESYQDFAEKLTARVKSLEEHTGIYK